MEALPLLALSLIGGSLGYTALVYGVGLLAMLLSVIAFQFRHRVTIILFNLFGQLCWVLYFLMQSDHTSAIACLLSAVMLAVFSMKDRWSWTTGAPSVVLFTALVCGFSLLSFSSWLDIFPLLAGLFCVLANSRSTEKRLRQLSLFWCAFWLLNSILRFYPVALLNDLFCTASAAHSLYRFREK